MRAQAVERAIHVRHLRRLWGVPGTLLGVVGWPASIGERCFAHWHYWWQAHLLNCLVDAYQRSPTPARHRAIQRLIRGVYLRNLRSWRNSYYDDLAWLGLALLRADRFAGLGRPDALGEIATRLRQGWTTHAGGGIWWRVGSDFKNVPTNGPAAILLTRLSDPDPATGLAGGDPADYPQACSIVDWLEQRLLDPATGLVADGLHVDQHGAIALIEKTIYTYCQGVFLGACVELATRASSVRSVELARLAARTITATAERITVPGEHGPVLRGQGGGDGGLFAGILARYLALAAGVLPTFGTEFCRPARTAAELVFHSAESAWRYRLSAPGGPLFGPDWASQATQPWPARTAARDLSVQLGGWMLIEAAAMLARSRN